MANYPANFIGPTKPVPVAPSKKLALPQLNRATGQATYSAPAAQGPDPVQVFTENIYKLLGKAQGANQGNAALMARAGDLQNTQITNSMGNASQLGIENLAPGDALAARKNESELYNPEIRSLNDRMKLNNEAVSRLEEAIKAAKQYGEDYAKYVKPDDATIQAVIQQMEAGFIPSQDVLDKVQKYLPADIWIKAAKAKKAQSGGGGGGSTASEVIGRAKNLSRGKDGMANPNDYLDLASEYISNNGSVSDFLAAVPPGRYLTPSNEAWVREQLTGKKQDSGTPWG